MSGTIWRRLALYVGELESFRRSWITRIGREEHSPRRVAPKFQNRFSAKTWQRRAKTRSHTEWRQVAMSRSGGHGSRWSTIRRSAVKSHDLSHPGTQIRTELVAMGGRRRATFQFISRCGTRICGEQRIRWRISAAAPAVPTLQIVRPFPKFLSDGVAPIDHTALVCITPNCRRTSGERASTSFH